MKVMKSLKDLKGLFIFVFITAIVVLAALLMNRYISDLHLIELNAFLQAINIEGSKKDYIDLVHKFSIYKDLYIHSLKEEELNSLEIEMSSISASKEDIAGEQVIYPKIPLMILNTIRIILWKKPVLPEAYNESKSTLKMAYLFERNKDFKQAIQYYIQTLETIPEGESYIKAVIFLRVGFCYAIIGNDNMARKYYKLVIDHYPDEEISFTAFMLLNYLERFDLEREKVRTSDRDTFEKSRALYSLIAYEEAYTMLKNLDDDEGAAYKKDMVAFYEARCLEEMGYTEDALETYQTIILENSESPYARLSNKRIFTNAVAYSRNEDLSELARKNNELINDPSFDEMTLKAGNLHSTETDEEEPADSGQTVSDSGSDTKNGLSEFVTRYMTIIDEKINTGEEIRDDQELDRTKEKVTNEYLHFYDSSGRKEKSIYYGEDSQVEFSLHYEYTPTGLLKKLSRFDPGGNLLNYYYYEYDDENKPSSVTSYDADGNIISD